MAKKKALKTSALRALGASPRSYDNYLEMNTEEERAAIAQVMLWVAEENPNLPQEKSEKLTNISEKIVQGAMSLNDVGVDNVPDIMQALDLKPQVAKAGRGVIRSLYYNAKDILKGRRVKTALMVAGFTLAGAAAGAAIGAAVVPLFGGAAGAVIGAIVGGLGGAAGLGLIGGAFGRWVGKKIAKKTFKNEKHYQISTKKTGRIKKTFGIPENTVLMMNAYMYNRQLATKIPICKDYYKVTRKNAMKGNKEGLEAMARFFVHELFLLQNELTKEKASPEIHRDIQTVKTILNDLRGSQISQKTRKKISEVLDSYHSKTGNIKVVSKKESEDEYLKHQTPERRKSLLTRHEHTQDSANTKTLYRRFSVDSQNATKAPDLFVREQKPKNAASICEVNIDRAQFKDMNEVILSDTLVEEAKVIYLKTKNPNLIVVSDGDPKIAIQLMAAALKANLSPSLDEEEFPEKTPEEQAIKKQIIEKAYQLAGKEPPHKKPSVGYKI